MALRPRQPLGLPLVQQLLDDLANPSYDDSGAGMIAYSAARAYPAGTVGAALQAGGGGSPINVYKNGTVASTSSTSLVTLASQLLPALDKHARIRLELNLECTGNTNLKEVEVQLAGTQVFITNWNSASATSTWIDLMIQNQAVATAQGYVMRSNFRGSSATNYDAGDIAANTALAPTLAIRGRVGVGTDTLTLKNWNLILEV